jgi:hypothetical protein
LLAKGLAQEPAILVAKAQMRRSTLLHLLPEELVATPKQLEVSHRIEAVEVTQQIADSNII